MKKLTVLAALALALPLLAGEEIVLETETGKLFGTLELPAEIDGKLPAVLIHPGSGPTDSDGNSAMLQGKSNSLKYLAEALAAEGIASVRIDKRGVARSLGAGMMEKDLRFDHYVDDVRGWLDKLRADERFSKVVMLGHSEGALIGSLASPDRADAFVAVAGAGFPAGETLRKQLQPRLPPALWEQTSHILDELEAGRTVEDPPKMLNSLLRITVQPYLISWFKHDPRKTIAALDVPVLIVQGDTDLQIKVEDARALAAAKPEATLVLIEGMNHVLKDVPAEPTAQQASYGDPELPVHPELVAAVVSFVDGDVSQKPESGTP